MKLIIDTVQKTLKFGDSEPLKEIELYSKEAFELISHQWLKVSCSQKYSYTFTWMGRPVIQLPEDILRTQEVIFQIKPDVIIETGVAHGGSLILYASLCKVLERGRVIGIDIEIRTNNRKALESHPLKPWITLIEGSSVAPETVAQVRASIKPGDKVMVLLDSDHTKQHVLNELEAYHDMVTPGSYIIATDGILRDLKDVPQGYRDRMKGDPCEAVREFLAAHKDFILEQPRWLFNESLLTKNITYWPDAWLRKIKT